MKKKILILISIIAILGSCDSQLDDIRPFNTIDGSAATGTSKDIESLLVGAYSTLGDGDVYGGNLQRDAELIADDWDNPLKSEMFWDGTFTDPGEIWVKNILVTNGQAENTYLDAYRVINICNTVLANLSVVTPDKLDRVEGGAKFIRGTLYFELVRVFARTWTDPTGTPATNPGVPLVLTPDVVEKVDRSSVADVYAQIITDLTDAATKLPSSNGFFASSHTANAMLSRVYLMQNNYASARDAANAVITANVYGLLPNYADNFNNSSNGATNASIEDVFSVQVTTQAGINNMNTFFSTAAGGRGDIYVEPAHFALYTAGDERLALFYDGERTGKWDNQFGNVNIIRYAEMYLTRAEGNFREGTAVGDTPLNDVNRIRNRSSVTSLGVITSVDDILAERHIELAFEGHFIHDLKRTQKPVGPFAFNAPELIFPIPKRETIINPTMQQNDGYN